MTRKRSATDLMTAKILQEEISSIADEKEPRGSAAGTLAGEPVLNVGTLVPFPTDRPRPAPRYRGAAEARSMPLALVEAIESLEALTPVPMLTLWKPSYWQPLRCSSIAIPAWRT